MHVLDIRHLNVFHKNIQVVWDVSMQISRGEIVSLIGSNGAGKSSLVESIFGLNRNCSGEILFETKMILGEKTYEIVRTGIALIPEKRELFPKMSVQDNLMLGAYLKGDEPDLDHMFKIFPVLKDRQDQLAGTLSGGEQQMLAIARGVVSGPKMLVLDEPSIGLSPILVESVFDSIQKLNNDGITILLVEQNTLNALEISDRGYVLENGRIKLEGNASDLLSSDEVREAYLGM